MDATAFRQSAWGGGLGALLGAAVAGVATLPDPGLRWVWLGIPFSLALGWLLGPRAVARRRGTRLLMALGCTLGGAILTGIWWVATSVWPSAPPPPGLPGLLEIAVNGSLLGLLGAVIYGLPALAVLYPVAWLWGELVRRVGESA